MLFQSYYFLFVFYYTLTYISIIHVVGFSSGPVFLRPFSAGDFFHYSPTTIVCGVWTCCSCDWDRRSWFAFHSGTLYPPEVTFFESLLPAHAEIMRLHPCHSRHSPPPSTHRYTFPHQLFFQGIPYHISTRD